MVDNVGWHDVGKTTMGLGFGNLIFWVYEHYEHSFIHSVSCWRGREDAIWCDIPPSSKRRETQLSHQEPKRWKSSSSSKQKFAQKAARQNLHLSNHNHFLLFFAEDPCNFGCPICQSSRTAVWIVIDSHVFLLIHCNTKHDQCIIVSELVHPKETGVTVSVMRYGRGILKPWHIEFRGPWFLAENRWWKPPWSGISVENYLGVKTHQRTRFKPWWFHEGLPSYMCQWWYQWYLKWFLEIHGPLASPWHADDSFALDGTSLVSRPSLLQKLLFPCNLSKKSL